MSLTRIKTGNISNNAVTGDKIAAGTITTNNINSSVNLGGPKISSITYPGDDTAADTAGGQTIVLAGNGFSTGVTVLLDGVAVPATSYVDAQTIQFTAPAKSTGSYIVYVVNTDGSTAILVPGMQYSGTPTWVTASGPVANVYETTAVSTTVSATGDGSVTYALAPSNTLPVGLSLAANGQLSGSTPADSGSTTYSFYIRATDSQNQDTDRQFNITVNTDVVTWSSPANNVTYTLLQNIANTTSLAATSAAGYDVSYSANTLPDGLSVSGSTITGTPTTVANTSSLITATAGTTGRTAVQTINWIINVAGDTYWKNTTLLVAASSNTTPNTFNQDSSLNNSQLIIAGDTRSSKFHPYNQEYSAAFPVSTDYLSTPATTELTTFAGDFTIEAWIHPTDSNVNSGWCILDARQSGGSSAAFVFAVNALASPVAGQGRLAYFNGTTYSGTGIVYFNRWTHIAFVRIGSTMTFYVNGVAGGTATISGTQTGTATSNPVFIGTKDGSVGGYGTTGYISNLRVVNGVGVYTGNFTPSTSRLTAVPKTVLLACQDNRPTDNSPYNRVITNAGTSGISRAHPFPETLTPAYQTGYSTFLDGTGDSLSVAANTAFNLTGDFTVECWVNMANTYPASSDDGWGGPSFVTMTNGGNAGSISGDLFLGLTRSSSGAVPGIWQFSGVSGGNNFGNVSIQYADVAPTASKWYHLALTRSGTSVKAFLDGKLAGSATSSAAFGSSTHDLYIGTVNYTYARYLNGTVSNVRIVNGTALYTTASTTNGTQIFTPSTAPLTAVENTKLLTCQSSRFVDNSTNAFTITAAGHARPVATSPFTSTSNTDITYLGSAYFDGSGDNLTIPADRSLSLSGDFTVEAWIYPTAINTNNMVLGSDNGASSDYLNITSTTINMAIGTGLVYPSWNYTFSPNRWYHIAITRSGSNMTAFVNGVSLSAQQYAQTFLIPGTNTFIGRYGYASNPWYFTGYINDVRIVNGTALYTSNFLPTQTPATAVANTKLLTCQYSTGATNTKISDQGDFNITLTKNGNVTQGTFSPYSPTGWSHYFGGSSDYLQIPEPAATSADVTVECWVYPTVTTARGFIFSAGGTGAGAWAAAIAANNTIEVFVDGYSGTKFVTALTVTDNAWNHIALVKASGVVRLYVNGTRDVGSYSQSGNFGWASSTTVTLGAYNISLNQPLIGYISNFRYTQGTALYTGSTATVPTGPLAATPSTKILTCNNNRLTDDSPSGLAVTATGQVRARTFSPFGGSTSVPTSYSNYFDGSTSAQLVLASNTAFAFGTGAYTMEGWVHLNAAATTASTLFDAGNATNSISLGIQNNGAVQIGKYGVGTALVSSSGDVPLNTWVHVAAVRTSTGTNDTRIYVNGVLKITGTDSNNWTVTNTPTIGGINISGFTTNGHISGLRIVKGYAITPPAGGPTGPLTAVTGTSLLACQSSTMVDGSTNAFTMTPYGAPKVQSFNPFGMTSTASVQYSPVSHGGSLYFDGTGDYLTAPSTSVAATMQPGEFTFETWIYPIAPTATNSAALLYGTWNNGSNQWAFEYCHGGLWGLSARNVLYVGNYGSNECARYSTTQLPLYSWSHIAWVRNSAGAISFYINGVAQTLTSYNSGASFSEAYYNPYGVTCGIGGSSNYSSFQGYLSDMKYSQGAALYTANFYPPITPLKSTTVVGNKTYSSTLLLNGTAGGIIDSHCSAVLEVAGDAKMVAEDPYAGGYYSNYFDGTGDSLTLAANTAFDFGTGDLTIECHFMLMADATATADGDRGATLFSCFETTTPLLNDYSLAVTGNTSVTGTGIGFSSRYGGTQTLATYSSAVTKGVWHHVAVTKTGNTASLYYDGNRVVQNASFNSQVNSGGYIPRIGTLGPFANSGYTSFFPGYISNLRVVKGSQVYTGTTYTVPTAPLTVVSGTSLLTCQSNRFNDNSTNNYAITPTGDASVKTRNPYRRNDGGSVYFDGTGDWISFNAAQYYLGASDFTIEGWINVPSVDSTYRTVFSLGNPVQIYSRSGTIECYINDSDDTTTYIVNGVFGPANSIVPNTWTHIALVRSGTNFTVYVNGVAGTAATGVSAAVAATASAGQIGAILGTYPFTGYIRDLRVTRGVARTITVPVEPMMTK